MDSYALHLLPSGRVHDRLAFRNTLSPRSLNLCVCVLERESILGTLLVNGECVDLTNEDESNILRRVATVNGRASGTTFHACDWSY